MTYKQLQYPALTQAEIELQLGKWVVTPWKCSREDLAIWRHLVPTTTRHHLGLERFEGLFSNGCCEII